MYPAERSAHVCNGERSGKARPEDRGFYRRLSNRAEARLVPGKLRRPCPKDTARLPIRADRQPCCESIQCRGGTVSIRPAVPYRGVFRVLPGGSVSHAKPPRSESLNPVKSPGTPCWWKLCPQARGDAPKKGALATHYSYERPCAESGQGDYRQGLFRAFVYMGAWDISKRVQAVCVVQRNSGACTLKKPDTRARAPSSKPP